MRRVLVTAVVTALMGLALRVSATELPRPDNLAPEIAFWKRIYTQVSGDQAMIHDRRELGRIYAVIDLPPRSEPEARRAAVKAAVSVYRGVLERLAAHPDAPASALERRVRAVFSRDAVAGDFREAADRLRVQGGLRERFREGLVRSGHWIDYIRRTLREHGVPEVLAAMPHVESSFNPAARSHAGAAGMWQFTRATGRRYMRIDGVIDERLDPWSASEAAARLLADNYARLGSWPLAITAYNHGANGMQRAVETVGTRDIGVIIHQYDGPYFGFASRNFYPAIVAAVDVAREPERYFKGVKPAPAWNPVIVKVPDFMPVRAIAGALGLDEGTLHRYNLGLRRGVWAGEKFVPEGYALRVPAREPGDVRQALAGVSLDQRYAEQWPDQHHRVRAGESLSAIAARHDVPTLALAAVNGITRPDHIVVGRRLRVPMAGKPPKPLSQLPVDEGGAVYTVQNGDTLAAIARRYDMGVDALVATNDIGDPDLIRPGQELVVREAPLPRRIAGNY